MAARKERQPGEPLANARHEAFAVAYALTSNASESYRKATGKAKNADVLSIDWLVKPGIPERINELRLENGKRLKKSREDIVDFLADVVDGSKRVTKEQLKAAELLNRMCGWNEPDKVEGAMTVVVKIGGHDGND